jgi:hypothetical protein
MTATAFIPVEVAPGETALVAPIASWTDGSGRTVLFTDKPKAWHVLACCKALGKEEANRTMGELIMLFVVEGTANDADFMFIVPTPPEIRHIPPFCFCGWTQNLPEGATAGLPTYDMDGPVENE